MRCVIFLMGFRGFLNYRCEYGLCRGRNEYIRFSSLRKNTNFIICSKFFKSSNNSFSIVLNNNLVDSLMKI